MTVWGLRGMWIILRYELRQATRNLLTWAALLCLLGLPPAMGFIFGGSIQVNGHPVAEQIRQTYGVVVGLTTVNFLATLYVLCLSLERTGSSYLRHNDILILARSVGRMPFWLAKWAGIFLPGLAYLALGLVFVLEEIVRHGGIWAPGLLAAELPMGLGLMLLAALYLALRNFFGNFIIFFVWLLVLPVLYVGDLWHLYGGVLREAGPRLGLLGLLPQLGSLHGLALGWAQPNLERPEALLSLVNGGIWILAGVAFGLIAFVRKRL